MNTEHTEGVVNLGRMGRLPGTRQPTIPDGAWQRALPKLREKIGTQFLAKDVAEAVGVSRAAVSHWLNDKARPNQTNLIWCLQFIGEDPAEIVPELVPMQRPASVDPVDEALLQLIYENPMKATAYVMAASQEKALQAADSLTSTEAVRRIRVAVGEDISAKK